MKKIVFLFLFFLCSFCYGASTRLSLQSYYTTDSTLEIQDIPDSAFSDDNRVNSFVKDGYCWVQAYIPVEALKNKVHVLKFSDELFNFGQLYFQDRNGKWVYLGSTGFERPDDNNHAYFNNAVVLPHEFNFPDDGQPVKIRAKIFCDHSILVKITAMNMGSFMDLRQIRQTHLSFFFGAVVMTIFFIAWACVSFDDYNYVYLIVVCALLALYVLLVNGVLDGSLKPLFSSNNVRNSMIYFVLTGTSLCGCWFIINRNKPFLKQFPLVYVKLQEFFPFFVLILIAVGFLFTIVPVTDDFLHGFRIFGIAVPYLFFINQMVAGRKHNPSFKLKPCIMWLLSCGVILIQQIFLYFRFKEGVPSFFSIFNEDKGIPEAFALLVIGMSVVELLGQSLRTRFAVLQIQMKEADYMVSREYKHNFVYSKISAMLLNMLQVFSASLEETKAEDGEKMKLLIKSNMDYSMQLIKTLSVFSEENKNANRTYYAPGSLYLHTLVTETMEPEYVMLKKNNCFVDVHEHYSEESCVYADRDLLALVMRFMIQTVHNVVIPKTQVLVSAEYKKSCFTISIKFSTETVTVEQAKLILGFGKDGEKDFEQDELLRKWGVELYVASLVADFLKGSISIVPDMMGCVICARLPLNPAITYLEDNIHEQNFLKLGSDELLIPSSDEVVYILEENNSVRTILEKAFSPYFKTVILGNGIEFLDQIKRWPPDFVICSMELPGKNAMELLEEDALKSVPFFVITKFATRKVIANLYDKGAMDVFQKPFNLEYMVRKVFSAIKLRKSQSEVLLKSIHESFSQTVFGKKNSGQNFGEYEVYEMLPADSSDAVIELKEEGTVASKVEGNEEKLSLDGLVQALCVSAGLTKKETAIALLIAMNKSDKEIAMEMGISPSTVAVHNKKIFKKLEIHSRSELLEKIK